VFRDQRRQRNLFIAARCVSSAGTATADLLRHATIYQKHAQTELVTPTGAAILAAVVDRFASLNGFAAERIGYGAGTNSLRTSRIACAS
jgi:uncharacterized protein (DUF111 family)